jgi:hypothetical protein
LQNATNCATNLIIIISWKSCKLQQIVQTQERKSSLKMWQNHATIMHTTNYPIAPLLLLLFLLPCGASLMFQKNKEISCESEERFVIFLPSVFLGKKCWAMEDAHMWTPSSSSSSSSKSFLLH